MASRLSRRITKLPRSIDSDDVQQDAAEIVLRRAREYAESPNDVPFFAWLWTRCLGDLKDKYKTSRTRDARGAPQVLTETDLGTLLAYWPSEKIEHNTFNPEWLRAAVDELNPREKEAVNAVFFRGLTQEQYGEELGISQPAVSQIIRRALRSLKVLLEN